MDIRVEMSGSFEEAGRKILEAEKQRWMDAAKYIESTVRCQGHRQAPTTHVLDTSEGWSVEIGACCEDATKRARQAFENEIIRLRG